MATSVPHRNLTTLNPNKRIEIDALIIGQVSLKLTFATDKFDPIQTSAHDNLLNDESEK
ncbi:hypothetical protein GCM10007978_37070 [Shewanella hanedai]|nr:hypothetical protein GCM10007978_37070 [Shewanella hanedai]